MKCRRWRVQSAIITAAIMTLLGPFMVAAAEPKAADAGFVEIFNGKNLDGWDGNPAFWTVKDGAIVGQTTKENPTKGNTFLIWRQGEVDDFELTLEYRINGGNSGIQYRSFEVPNEKWVVGGYQADIEDGDTYSGINYGERFRGVLALRGQKTVIGEDQKPKVVATFADGKKLQSEIKKGDWNTYHIVARGHDLTHRINGVTMSEVTDNDTKSRRRAGVLALQLHAGPPMKIEFRNIRLKRLALANARKVVFIAGGPSHGWGAHEHYAGCRLLADALNASGLGVVAAVYRNGWPADPTAFDNANGLVVYADGAGGHPLNPKAALVDAMMKKGLGLTCLHFAVEVPKETTGKYFLDWLGGYFELFWSVNPHWTAEFKKLPEHPITRGVKPFRANDEWYYHMRFRESADDVTPILTATPPDATRERDFGGSRGGNAAVVARRGQPEVVAWARQRPDGGRGFGFTGGHVHANWGNDEFRKLVLNAILWTAGGDPPADGVPSRALSSHDLDANQDEPKPGSKQ